METITKLGENHVVVSIPSTEEEEYGQIRIDEEHSSLVAEQELINNYDKEAMLKKVQDKLDRLNLIQIEMDKD